MALINGEQMREKLQAHLRRIEVESSIQPRESLAGQVQVESQEHAQPHER